MGTKHPYSGLTDQQEQVLLAAGWRETGLESLPPPWSDGVAARIYHPAEAYEECVRRLRETREAAAETTAEPSPPASADEKGDELVGRALDALRALRQHAADRVYGNTLAGNRDAAERHQHAVTVVDVAIRAVGRLGAKGEAP